MIRRLLVKITATVVTVVVISIGVIAFAIMLATRSHPSPYRETEARVRDSVRVYRNSFGIPHIVGRSIRDVVFAQGYTHAQDRLWQMDFWRRSATGRTAEIFGSEGVQLDAFMRTLNIEGIARQHQRLLSKTAKQLLEAYCDGVNSYIEENRNDLPFEFDALGYKPEPWTPEDCLVLGRAMAFELSLGFWSDITYAQIQHQRGAMFIADYIPRDQRGPYVLDTLDTPSRAIPQESSSISSTSPNLGSIRAIRDNILHCRERLGLRGAGFGSNCWVMKNPQGGTIVANDPHLSASAPAKWYQVHLSAPNLNVVGLSIPGMPLVLSGRNDHLAWGFTNAMIDDVDYVVERCDSSNPDNYFLDAAGKKTKFTFVADTIHVAGAPDTIISIRATKTSRVISDHHLMRNPPVIFDVPRVASTSYRFPEKKSQEPVCLTFRWAAAYPSDEITAMYRVNTAKSVDQVMRALETWGSPALSFTVGSASGLMATLVAGNLPVRGSADPRLPIASWQQGADWSGITNLTALGRVLNPARGWLATANNRLSPSSQYVGSLFEPSSRIERINELLRLYRRPTVRDVQMMQQDVVSPYAKRVLERVLPILVRSTKRFSTEERKALAMLQGWDAGHTPLDNAASVFSIFLDRLVWSTFEDELGQQLYFDWTLVPNIPLRRVDELLDEPEHRLWDDVRTTTHTETMPWIVLRAFHTAIQDLKVHFAADPQATWEYGKIHTVTFPHVFGRNELMRPTMNLGPFDIGGSQTTVNNTQWKFSTQDPHGVMLPTTVVASMRVISNMSDSVQYTVLPGGASGQPLEAHYSDQMQLWLKGGYVKVPVNAKPDVSFRLYHIFSPR
ncbi:MAG: penicillin acylase family protein [Candidatus Kapaibacterium sp.]